jgi:hypothetical protein
MTNVDVDIVEVLRPLTQWFSEVQNGIDEIERLRGLLREWVDSPCQPIAADILRRTQEALDHD